ncbi:MAG: ferredoxin-type protein NapH [Natronomonas sp.]|jgi:ferredoxin-type protein NapH
MFGRTVSAGARVGYRTMHFTGRSVPVDRVRAVCQAAFLVLFGWLLVTGQYRLWMVVVGVGLASTAVAGRWYCGWACPIDASYRAIDRLYAILGVDRRQTPSLLRRSWLRWTIAAGFVGLIVANRALGLATVPILYVTGAGIAIGLVFEPRTFHRYLCPFGAVFSLLSRFQRFGFEVDEDECLECGHCEATCPNEAIDFDGPGTPAIDADECLTCFACREACSTDAIEYGNG